MRTVIPKATKAFLLSPPYPLSPGKGVRGLAPSVSSFSFPPFRLDKAPGGFPAPVGRASCSASARRTRLPTGTIPRPVRRPRQGCNAHSRSRGKNPRVPSMGWRRSRVERFAAAAICGRFLMRGVRAGAAGDRRSLPPAPGAPGRRAWGSRLVALGPTRFPRRQVRLQVNPGVQAR